MLKDLLFKFAAVLLLVSVTSLAYGQGATCEDAEVVAAGTYTVDEIPADSGGNTQPDATGAVWYAYTPDENGAANVATCLGGADTRAIIWTATCDALEYVADNDDACPFLADGTGDAFASDVSFSVVAGTTYYIEFDNRWDSNGFEWSLDFSNLPAADVAGAGGQLPATQLPFSQAADGIPLTGVLGNLGSGDLTNATLTVEVFAEDDLETPVFTATSDGQDLSAGDVVDVDFGVWMPAMAGQYVIVYTAASDEEEGEGETGNNGETVMFDLQNTYAFDGPSGGSLGNPASEIWQGNNFTFTAAETIEMVTMRYSGEEGAELMQLSIYSTDPETGAPVDELYFQDIPGQGSNPDFDIIVLDTPFEAAAGETYWVGLHSITVANVGLGTDANNFYEGNAWLYLAVIAENWITPESVGFEVSYAVRLHTGVAPYDLTLAVDMANEDVGDNGVYVAGTFNGWDPTATELTDEDGDGIYTATVSVDSPQEVEYKFLNGPDFMFEESVPEECGVDNGLGGFNRALTMIAMDMAVDAVCFGECSNCPIEQEPCTNPDAVICDNFDQYELGPVSDQSDQWVPWPGGTSAPVTDAFAQSGTQSLQVIGGGSDDQLLLFPENYSSGNYTLRWSMYVPGGKGAYYNIQGERDNPGNIFKMQLDFTPDGTANLDAGAEDAAIFDYPQDQWFDVIHYIDFDNDWVQLVVDGELIHTWLASDDTFGPGAGVQMGAVNLFPLSADYEAYYDDVEMVAVPSCADESIICDPLEGYQIGDLNTQAPWWGLWPAAGVIDGTVVQGLSNGGEKSLSIDGGNSGASEFVDVLLLLGDRTEGNYRVAFDLYTEAGALAYYNIQNVEATGQWNLDVFLDGDGTGRVQVAQADVATFTYTEGAWNTFEHFIDLDAVTISVDVNGETVHEDDYAGDQLGAVNFFPIDDTYVYNVDNVNFSELEPTVVEPDPVMFSATVNTDYIIVEPDGMFFAGTPTGWQNEAMTDNGDGTWTYTTMVDANTTVEWKFKNGADGWEVNDNGGDCIQGADNNRFLEVGETDADAGTFCFNTCVADCDLTGTVDASFNAAFEVTPNPNSGIFTVNYSLETAADLNIRVTNMLGQDVEVRNVASAVAGAENFNLSEMPAGSYSLIVTDGERVSVKRVVLQ